MSEPDESILVNKFAVLDQLRASAKELDRLTMRVQELVKARAHEYEVNRQLENRCAELKEIRLEMAGRLKSVNEEKDRLKAENQKLREALEAIAKCDGADIDTDPWWCIGVAEKALEDKKEKGDE